MANTSPVVHSRAGRSQANVSCTGWQVTVRAEMPETVKVLLPTQSRSGGDHNEELYVGTGPKGGVYRFTSTYPNSYLRIGDGMGDLLDFGTCEAASLAIDDLDADGVKELIALTNQIMPRGRPRLYIWSLESPPVLRAMARPEIDSSWGHGLGFPREMWKDSKTVLSTFCGHGEVVEYRLRKEKVEDGHAFEALTWKRVSGLPVSGEQLVAADVTNNGQTDICIAAGFATNKAAIRVYSRFGAAGSSRPTSRPTFDAAGFRWRLLHEIDEENQFANVRFVIGDLRGDGVKDVVAWWCSDLIGGDCEVIHYVLGWEGIRQRTVVHTGKASDLWPIDGQFTAGDLDSDGADEVFFTTISGNLWQYDPLTAPWISCICKFDTQLGPVAMGVKTTNGKRSLYVGSGRYVLRLDPFDYSAPKYDTRQLIPSKRSL